MNSKRDHVIKIESIEAVLSNNLSMLTHFHWHRHTTGYLPLKQYNFQSRCHFSSSCNKLQISMKSERKCLSKAISDRAGICWNIHVHCMILSDYLVLLMLFQLSNHISCKIFTSQSISIFSSHSTWRRQ